MKSTYRVLVHMGHVAPREPGFESGTGTAGEIQAVKAIGTRLANLLKKDGRFTVTLAPGDVPDGWRGDVLLALHCDGAGNKDARGYSLGWPPAEYGGRTARLLSCLRHEYELLEGHPPHHADNYTGDMRGYYAWHKTSATAKVLIEHGFLTNPADRKFVTGRGQPAKIAGAWYRALCLYFELPPLRQPAAKPKPKPKPAAVVPVRHDRPQPRV